MNRPATLILDHLQINRKIKRIAYQIYEHNVDEDRLILAGIANKGFELAERIKMELQSISDIEVILCEVIINKKDPLQKIKTTLSPEDYRNQSIVLVDDVLNSGSTLIYGVRHFLDVPLKQFRTAVLVDRSHKKFPVKADFKGISLSTSLSETIKVSFSEKDSQVVLL